MVALGAMVGSPQPGLSPEALNTPVKSVAVRCQVESVGDGGVTALVALAATKASADIVAVLAAYDFTRFKWITDIAGGRGHLLRAVLAAVPAA